MKQIEVDISNKVIQYEENLKRIFGKETANRMIEKVKINYAFNTNDYRGSV